MSVHEPTLLDFPTFTLSLLPLHSAKSWELFLARAICGHSRQLFPAALVEFSVIDSTSKLLSAVYGANTYTGTQREKITEAQKHEPGSNG